MKELKFSFNLLYNYESVTILFFFVTLFLSIANLLFMRKILNKNIKIPDPEFKSMYEIPSLVRSLSSPSQSFSNPLLLKAYNEELINPYRMYNAEPFITQIFGPLHSAGISKMREFLSHYVAKFDYVILSTIPEAKQYFNIPPNVNDIKFPIVKLPNGELLYDPSEKELVIKLGWVTQPQSEEYDLAIYGAGPAGLSAAIHASYDGLKTILIEKRAVGGQAGSSPMIENFIGFPDGISGAELAEKARQQAVRLGAELCILKELIGGRYEIDSSGKITARAVFTDNTRIKTKANLVCCGIEYRKLSIPGEESLLNLGVFYGAGACESRYCPEEPIVVIGGGNGAAQAVLNFARNRCPVTMLVRANKLSPTISQVLVDRLTKDPYINIILNACATEFEGKDWLEAVKYKDKENDQVKTIPIKYAFVCIGGVPRVLPQTLLDRDESGYIITGYDLYKNGKLPSSWSEQRAPYLFETNVPGVFAAGDIRHGSSKRYAVAVGEGAMAAEVIEKYLSLTYSH